MSESRRHTSDLRECVRLLNEAALVVRTDMSDVLIPLLSCRDVLAAGRAPTADALRRWISLIETTRAVALTKGPDAEMVLAPLHQVEAILMRIRDERRAANRPPGYTSEVQGIQE